MRLPQPRIRTLMIVVAVAAVVCWLLQNAPPIALFVLGPLLGPLLGPVVMRRFVRDPVGIHLGGAMAGGILQGFVLSFALFCVVEFSGVIRSGGELYVGSLIGSMGAGFFVGLASLMLHVLRTALAEQARLARGSAEEPGIWFLDEDLTTSPRPDGGPEEKAAPARPVQ